MKAVTKKKCMTVEAATGAEFDRLYEEASNTLAERGISPREESDGHLCVHFKWDEVMEIPETAKDRFELKGICYKCRNCPHCEIDNDHRKKRHACDISPYGIVYDDDEACEFFYKGILAGEIKPKEE